MTLFIRLQLSRAAILYQPRGRKGYRKMKRYVKEYSNDKKRKIMKNNLYRDDVRAEILGKIDFILYQYKRQLLNEEGAIRALVEV